MLSKRSCAIDGLASPHGPTAKVLAGTAPATKAVQLIAAFILLRDAFVYGNLLPEDILYRQKHAFSDAVSSPDQSWYKSLVSYIDDIVSDEELTLFNSITSNETITKEAYYYKKIFNELFPNRENVLTHYWMPQWTDTKGDPSATVLPCF